MNWSLETKQIPATSVLELTKLNAMSNHICNLGYPCFSSLWRLSFIVGLINESNMNEFHPRKTVCATKPFRPKKWKEDRIVNTVIIVNISNPALETVERRRCWKSRCWSFRNIHGSFSLMYWCFTVAKILNLTWLSYRVNHTYYRI